MGFFYLDARSRHLFHLMLMRRIVFFSGVSLYDTDALQQERDQPFSSASVLVVRSHTSAGP